jgi:hypothetical protein
MNLRNFRASGRDVPDLCAPSVGCLDENEVRPGRVYASNLYIEQVDHKDGKWLLVLNRSEWLTDDLARLEVPIAPIHVKARVHHESPRPNRWWFRSLTDPNIAAAMAAQWGAL